MAAAVIALISGMAFDETSITQLALFSLLAFGGSWLWSRNNLRRVHVTRSVPKAVYTTHDFTIGLELHNDRAWLPAFGIELEDRLLHFSEKNMLIQSVPPRNSRSLEARTRIVQRGYLRSETCALKSSFPFGLFTVRRRDHVSARTTVFPNPETPRALKMLQQAEFMEGEMGYRPALDWTGEFRGIRHFHAGDPVKAIHWAASSRSTQLVVRECDFPVAEKISIVFHSYFADGQLIQAEAFEHSMRLLAGLLYYCQRRNAPLDLTSSFLEWKTFEIPDPQRLESAMGALATAKQHVDQTPDALVRCIKTLPGFHPIYILGDAGLDGWFQEIPAIGRKVLCLDNSGLRIRQPQLNFRRIKRKSPKQPVASQR